MLYNVDGECIVVLYEIKINLYEFNSILNNFLVYCYVWFDLNLIIKKVILINILYQFERLNVIVWNEQFLFEKGFGFKISLFLVFFVLCCCKKYVMLMKNCVYVEYQEIILYDYVWNLLCFVLRVEIGKF